MPEDIQFIRGRLKELEAAIAEVKSRLPAHSVKPPIMQQLLDLEDEYDLWLKKLEKTVPGPETEPENR